MSRPRTLVPALAVSGPAVGGDQDLGTGHRAGGEVTARVASDPDRTVFADAWVPLILPVAPDPVAARRATCVGIASGVEFVLPVFGPA